MGYSIDLSALSLIEYEQKLKNKTLIPSQQLLTENISERFAALRAAGISDAGELHAVLKNKDRVAQLAGETGIPAEYLSVLLRELKGRQSKPRKLADFSGIASETITKLQADGIKTTKQLYGLVLTLESREELADRLDLDMPALLALTKQADLTRIQWVNATFARVLFEAGYDDPDKVATADAQPLYDKIRELNAAKNLYKGNIGLNDIRICIEAAQEVDCDIQY